jgi:hypothetical protein
MMPKMHISSGINTFSVLLGRAVCRVRDRTDQSFPDSLVKQPFARSFGGDADASEESKSLIRRTLSCEMPVIFLFPATAWAINSDLIIIN